MGGDGGPLVVRGVGAHALPCPGVPVGGVRGVAVLAMKVGVEPAAVGGLEFVDEGVRGGPVAVGVEPEGVEWCWERGGF